MYGTTTRKGTVTAGELMVDLYPKPYRLNSGMVHFHGAGSSAEYLLDASPANQADLTMKVSSVWPGVSGGYGGDAWGNPASVAAANSYLAHLDGRVAGAVPGEQAFLGSSMGGLTALNVARATNGGTVGVAYPSCIVGIIPVINLADIVANNRGGFAAAVNSAYGGSYDDTTDGPTSNPYHYMSDASMLGIPMLIFYGLTDAICLPAFTEAFIAADPDNRTGVALASGHDYTSYNAVDHDQILEFLTTHQVHSGAGI